MRIFIASKLSSNYSEILTPSFEFFKKKGIISKLKPVKLDNIHLTYSFLGDIIGEEKLEELKIDIKKNFENFKKIEFFFKKVDFFPDKKKPKIIWASVDDNSSQELKNIYIKIKEVLNKNSVFTNENFVPHITLARVKTILLKGEIEKILSFEFENKNCFFENIAIMDSNLTSKGPEYRTLFEVNFI